MRFSDHLPDAETDISNAQKDRPFARELATGVLDDHSPKLSDCRQARIDRLFQLIVDLEAAFFETAHQPSSGRAADAQERDA